MKPTKQITPTEALNRLAAWCSRAERCTEDARKKLINWGITPDDQKTIIDRLKKERFLDDERFCRAFVNEKSDYSHWGIYKIRQKLREKRLPEELIGEALALIDQQSKREDLQRILENKKKTVKGKSDFEIRQKLIRFAAGRGFPLDEIEKVLGDF